MRRMKIFMYTIIITLSCTSMIHANSGPSYWRGYPSLETLAVEKNSPIEVESEKLVFDFSKEEYINKGDYNLSGLVSATYTMTNPTENKENVQMAFPFIATMSNFNPDEIIIKTGEEKVPYEVFIGDEIRLKNRKVEETEENRLDFNKILSSINKGIYSPAYFDYDEVGTLYKYSIKTLGEEVNIEIDYAYDREKTKVISKGFNGGSFGGEDNKESIFAWIREDEILEVFVVGEEIEIGINGYSDGEKKQPTDKYSYELTTEEISLGAYLNKEAEIYKEQYVYNEHLSENQIFNLYARNLDELIEKDVMNFWIDQMYALNDIDRVFVLVYDVEFTAKSSEEISVTYLTRGTMDSVETKEPLNTFEYLLSPASNWASFNDLTIEIIPPKKYPYIVSSSLDLIRNEDGRYIAEFTALPSEDLSFTLYSKEEVTFLDKVERQVYYARYFLPLLTGLIAPILVVGLKRKINSK